jgi:periplasmic protein CpxP/Spy
MEATKTFYAALTPEQQKVFDEKSHGKGGHSGGRGHGERGMNHS